MILISEANKIKREQHGIIQEYKQMKNERKRSTVAVSISELMDADELCAVCYMKVQEA